MGEPIMLQAFVVIVLGGLGSVVGAIFAGLLLGVIQTISVVYISSELSDAIVFSLLFLVLLDNGRLHRDLAAAFRSHLHSLHSCVFPIRRLARRALLACNSRIRVRRRVCRSLPAQERTLGSAHLWPRRYPVRRCRRIIPLPPTREAPRRIPSDRHDWLRADY